VRSSTSPSEPSAVEELLAFGRDVLIELLPLCFGLLRLGLRELLPGVLDGDGCITEALGGGLVGGVLCREAGKALAKLRELCVGLLHFPLRLGNRRVLGRRLAFEPVDSGVGVQHRQRLRLVKRRKVGEFPQCRIDLGVDPYRPAEALAAVDDSVPDGVACAETVPEGPAEAPYYAQQIEKLGEFLSYKVLATIWNHPDEALVQTGLRPEDVDYVRALGPQLEAQVERAGNSPIREAISVNSRLCSSVK